MSKRVKISFSEVNKGKVTIIDAKSISETNKRVRDEMRGVVRTYEKNETKSQRDAALLVLNA
ncbi:MAG: hypothetical protein ABIJ97_13410 [Bacteroidota bacterium]